MAPDVVIRPTLLLKAFGEPERSSGPATIPNGWEKVVGMEYSVTLPAVVIRPILLLPFSENHNTPSGPDAIPDGLLFTLWSGIR